MTRKPRRRTVAGSIMLLAVVMSALVCFACLVGSAQEVPTPTPAAGESGLANATAPVEALRALVSVGTLE